MSKQTKTNILNYLIDPTFSRANRLFTLSFENEDDRTSFPKYYTVSVETKDFNVLINGKSFFDVPIKKKEATHEDNSEMSKNINYTTGNEYEW